MAKGQWSRRDLFGAVTLFALAIGVPAAVVKLSDLDEKDAPTERQRKLMREVSDLVLPDTDEPGAGKTGVGDFLIVALAHGLDGTREAVPSDNLGAIEREHLRPDGSLRYLSWLERTLDRRANGDWLRLGREQREALLAKLDAEAFAEKAGDHPWKKVKGLILLGYYTSQTGGSRELNFELVPGRFDPKVPLAPGDKAYSSDWTAVEFG